MSEFLTFAGSGLYGANNFSEEAKKIGIQRAVQMFVLRGMNFGDKIFLAARKGVSRKDKGANLFGTGLITGLSYTGASAEVIDEATKNLHVIEIIGGSGLERRECGSYEIAATYMVNNSISEILEAIGEAAEKLDTNAKSFKYFVKGSFTEIDPPVIMPDQGFFRGFKKVSSAEDYPQKGAVALTVLENYQRKLYKTKKDHKPEPKEE